MLRHILMQRIVIPYSSLLFASSLCQFKYRQCRFMSSSTTTSTTSGHGSSLKSSVDVSAPVIPIVSPTVSTHRPVPINPKWVSDKTLESVIKVFAVTTESNFVLPWTTKPNRASTGSAFVIEGRRLLTNAHVVANQSELVVTKYGCAKQFSAQVQHVGHSCDLAVLTVDSEEFWDDLNSLTLTNFVPELQERVTVVGYPTGGANISLSVGVVSRVDLQEYVHGSSIMLAIQLDAAINSGNSGGPAIIDGDRVVGVAFQNLRGADGIGYVVPTPVIQHFLKDIERNGRFTGFPQFGFRSQNLDNAHLRKWLCMPEDATGIMVTRTWPQSPAGNVLRQYDAILRIDGMPISNDGSIAFRGKQRIMLDHILASKYIGDVAQLRVWREGKALDIELELCLSTPLVPRTHYDRRPSYLVHAGLVMTTLVEPYLEEWGSENWFNDAPRNLTRFVGHFPKKKDESIVVVSQLLPHPINLGYGSQTVESSRIISCNDISVRNLLHLKTILEESAAKVKANKDATNYDVFKLHNQRSIVLPVEEASVATSAILERYRIPTPFFLNDIDAAMKLPDKDDNDTE